MVGPAAKVTGNQCQYAKDRHQTHLRWKGLWTLLLFIFGGAVVLFLSLSVIFLLIESRAEGDRALLDYLPSALTLLGSMASGAAMAWVVARRNEAVTEEAAAYDDVRNACSSTADEDRARKKYRVLGV